MIVSVHIPQDTSSGSFSYAPADDWRGFVLIPKGRDKIDTYRIPNTILTWKLDGNQPRMFFLIIVFFWWGRDGDSDSKKRQFPKKLIPGDSKWPFDPPVGGHLTIERFTWPSQKGHPQNCQATVFPYIAQYNTMFDRDPYNGLSLCNWV